MAISTNMSSTRLKDGLEPRTLSFLVPKSITSDEKSCVYIISTLLFSFLLILFTVFDSSALVSARCRHKDELLKGKALQSQRLGLVLGNPSRIKLPINTYILYREDRSL